MTMIEHSPTTPSEVMAPTTRALDFDRLSFRRSWRAQERLMAAEGDVDEAQRVFLEDYASRTTKLIDAALEFDTDSEGNPVPADVVLFLDKSSRPLSWMMKALWDSATDGIEPKPSMPERKFANIDRLPWRINPEVEIVSNPDNFRQPSAADIAGLRAIFTDVNGHNLLDGKRIVIVDEVKDSGDTLLVAETLFATAFPDTEFKGFFWMDDSSINPDGTKRVMDRPVWYDSDTDVGRGVYGTAHPDDQIHRNKTERYTRESHQFLSTRPQVSIVEDGVEKIVQKDEASSALRREIGHMAMLVDNDELMPRPTVLADTHKGMSRREYVEAARERRIQHARSAMRRKG